jgi:hypothetical protein
MSDLTNKEQKAVRTALRFLRLRVGTWGPLAKALHYERDSIQKVATGKKPVTPALALRVARFAGVPMDDLLAGRWLSARSARTAATRRMISLTKKPWSSDPGLGARLHIYSGGCTSIRGGSSTGARNVQSGSCPVAGRISDDLRRA